MPDGMRLLLALLLLVVVACGHTATSASDAPVAGRPCTWDGDCPGLVCGNAGGGSCGTCVAPGPSSAGVEGADCTQSSRDTLPCGDGLVCDARGAFDRGRCVRIVVVADGQSCGVAGAICSHASYCDADEVCRATPAPHSLEAGAHCHANEDCAEALHCDRKTSVCAPRIGSGERCFLSGDCGAHLRCCCDADCIFECRGDEPTGSCVARIPEGQACHRFGGESQCEEGTACDPASELCVKPHALAFGARCSDDPRFACPEGGLCADVEDRICLRILHLGDPCGDPTADCEEHTHCADSTCVADATRCTR